MVRVIHQLKGRVRFEVPGLRRCRSLAMHLERELKGAPGLELVSANTLTGHVLVLFTDPQTPLTLAALIKSSRLAFLESRDDDELCFAATSEEPSFQVFPRDDSWSQNPPPSAAVKDSGEASRVPWHAMETGRVVKLLETNYELGLSEPEFQRRLARIGPNTLPGTFTRSLFEIITGQVNSLPVLLTGGAALLSFATGGILEGLLVMGIAALNVVIGAFVEEKAERTLSGVRESVNLRTQVLRDGQLQEVPFALIVPGDVLEIQAGCRIPADARLIRSDLLSVDESALTGESMPVNKTSAPIDDGDIPITERSNMVYRGTLVVEGTGYAVVVATGAETVLGKLQNFLGEVFPPEASMVRDMRGIATHLLRLGMSACCVFAVLSLLRGHSLLRIIKESLSLMAASVPSGLSTIAVGAFAMGHGDLRRSRVLVQRLRALGSLASTQIVCFDKTGTLTMNQMMPKELRAGGKVVKIETPSDDMENWSLPSHDPDIFRLVELAALCNEATLVAQDGFESIEGSSTEQSLLQLAAMAGIDPNALRSDYPMVHMTPRTEEWPFMVTVHVSKGGKRLIAMKGSPLEVLGRCTHVFQDGRAIPLTEEARQALEGENFKMAGSGLRVLGIAFRETRLRRKVDEKRDAMRLVWVGLIGLTDPVRPGAASVIQALQGMGIKTVVITGDQSLTARHIGEQLRLSGDDPLRILDANDMQVLSAAGLRSVVTQAHVFARLSPTQKHQIIQAYQDSGANVVMVGDGFNDVLALKVADVGIAMGRTGADLARKSADLVLEDDNIEAVRLAIGNGRAFYRNVRRSVLFLMTSSHADLLLSFGERSGLLSMGPGAWRNVWINLECLALALEPPAQRPRESLPVSSVNGLLSEDDMEQSLNDAVGIIAGALPAGLYGAARYGIGPDAEQLFLKSNAINEMLFGLACRHRDGSAADGLKSNAFLNTLLSICVGGYLVAAMLPGIGKSLGQSVLLTMDAAILAYAGFLSHAFPSSPEPRGNITASHSAHHPGV